MKKILEIIIKVVLWLIIIFIILWFAVNYFWNQTYKINNTINVCNQHNITLWKQLWKDNFTLCDQNIKWKCIEWSILSAVKSNNWNLNAIFELNKFKSYTNDSFNEYVKDLDNPLGFIYSIFSNDFEKKYYAKNYNDINKYIELDNNCEIKYYSKNDLEKMSNEKRNIFKELENNPSITIDWVDYSKK